MPKSKKNKFKSGTRKKKQRACRDNIDCSITNFRDKKYPNQIWNTCISQNGITNHILYVTPKNVLIKSVDTYQIPEFVIRMNHTQVMCSITFNGNYVSCFLRNCGAWYIVLIQPQSKVFNNFIYYKIKNAKNLLNYAGELSFKLNMFEDSKSNVLILNPDYLEKIPENTPIHNLLQDFVSQKNIARDIKEIGALIVADEVFQAFI